jgi:Ca-activated chloride channel family protein
MTKQGMFKTLLAALLMFVALRTTSGQDTIFRTETRLVEVYATIRDHNGRYLDGLSQDRFELRDNGQTQALAAFESNTSSLSCAILLDTTGSMAEVLPVVKNSVIKLIDAMSDGDSVAVFGFANGLNRLQEFTTDKASAKQAVLRTRAAGATALFDAISEVAREISPRTGKKALVVFTDGADNASLLNARAAIQRARKAGVPVYTIAEGDALKTKDLLKELRDISEGSAASAYEAHKTKDIADIFQDISGDLRHTYMLAYKPPLDTSQRWRTIQLSVVGVKDAKIRAKEGYLPE